MQHRHPQPPQHTGGAARRLQPPPPARVRIGKLSSPWLSSGTPISAFLKMRCPGATKSCKLIGIRAHAGPNGATSCVEWSGEKDPIRGIIAFLPVRVAEISEMCLEFGGVSLWHI